MSWRNRVDTSEMTRPKLTVVLATHNGVRWLPDLLASLAWQTLPPARLLVLDDASTDDTWALVRDTAAPGRQTVVSRLETNEGAIQTFERLLSSVETEYFALCDQDDVWLPDKLERSVRLLELSGADLVYTDLEVVDEDLHELTPSMWQFSHMVPVAGRPMIPLILKNCVTGCSVVGKTSILTKALPFPPGIPMHDGWLALVAACGAGIAPLHEATILYRQHGNNEIGAVRFGYRGLRSMLDRKGTRLRTYLQDRLDGRLALIDGLQGRGLMSKHAFLAWFYRQKSIVRFVLNPVYLVYTATHAGVVGFRSLAVDWMLTCLPLGSSKRVVKP